MLLGTIQVIDSGFFQLHVMDSPDNGYTGYPGCIFQLHVMDSWVRADCGEHSVAQPLSTPCDGFSTMGGLVVVYCLVIAGFYFVFYCCTPVLPAVGPPRSWRGVGVFKLYSTSSLAKQRFRLGVLPGHLATVEVWSSLHQPKSI